jgi:predicted lysophospholipase L1 biosynthesis ABC-type transport system permease subunit
MWPPKGSGFEANPFSPAGASQRYWWGVRKAMDAGRPISFRTYLLLMALLAVVVGGIAVGMALH